MVPISLDEHSDVLLPAIFNIKTMVVVLIYFNDFVIDLLLSLLIIM